MVLEVNGAQTGSICQGRSPSHSVEETGVRISLFGGYSPLVGCA